MRAALPQVSGLTHRKSAKNSRRPFAHSSHGTKPAAQIYYLDLGQTLDLRRRLVDYLGAMLLGLLLVTVLINLYSLRNDVTAEVIASE